MNNSKKKFVTRVAVIVFILPILVSGKDAEEKSARIDFGESYSNFAQSHRKMLAEVNSLKMRIKDLRSFQIRLHDLSNKKSKKVDSKKISEIYDQMHSDLPGYLIVNNLLVNDSYYGAGFSKKDNYVTNEGELTKIVEKGIQKIQATSPESCFDFSLKKYKGGAACESYRQDTCRAFSYGGSSDLGLYVQEVDFDIKITKFPLERFDDANAPRLASFVNSLVAEDGFHFCKTLSLAGIEFKPASFANVSIEIPEVIKPTFFPPISPEELKKCIEELPKKDWLVRLETTIDEVGGKYPLNLWKELFLERKAECEKGANYVCQNVSEVKGVAILSYLTVGCEVRDVTLNDIKRDIKNWTYSKTEAERLLHSELGDIIEVCQFASANGYSWKYKPVLVPKNCHKK